MDFVEKKLASLANDGLYRRLRTTTIRGATAVVDGIKVIHLCSNDYLGLSRNQHIIMSTASHMREISQCSSRLIAGNHPKILQLEEMLASHRKTESALTYPTGYAANLGAITSMVTKDSTIFSDELNHASIVDACRLTHAAIKIFKHNDINHLEELIGKVSGKKFVVTEGIFSMDGDMSKLREIYAIAKDNKAITIVDDAHGDFIFGQQFSGVPDSLGINIDIHISSMSKGLGCFGGYVATTKQIRELLINTSRPFIYSSAIPAHLCYAAIIAIPIAKKGHLQKRLSRNVSYFSKALDELGFKLGNSRSHIIPLLIGEERKTLEFSTRLLNKGIFVQAIRYPTVKKGSARLRVSLTASHYQKHLDNAIDAFRSVGRKMNII